MSQLASITTHESPLDVHERKRKTKEMILDMMYMSRLPTPVPQNVEPEPPAPEPQPEPQPEPEPEPEPEHDEGCKDCTKIQELAEHFVKAPAKRLKEKFCNEYWHDVSSAIVVVIVVVFMVIIIQVFTGNVKVSIPEPCSCPAPIVVTPQVETNPYIALGDDEIF